MIKTLISNKCNFGLSTVVFASPLLIRTGLLCGLGLFSVHPDIGLTYKREYVSKNKKVME